MQKTSSAPSEDAVVSITTSEDVKWHAVPGDSELLSQLDTSLSGLSSTEAAERLRQYGPNRLTPGHKPGFFRRLWNQLNNVLIFILLAAAAVTGGLQEWPEVGLILASIVINVAVGMFQEGKAEKAAEAIRSMLSPTATVIRDGERVSVDAEQLVVGDVVLFKSGDRVPADIRLVQVTNLQVQEAMLTGESLPVSKNLQPVSESAALGDRKCMAYSATTVMAGQGTGVVVATGDNAEIGRISKLVNQVKPIKTNLLVQLELLGRWLSVMVFIVVVAAFLLAKFKQHETFVEAFKSAVAIAVAIIPEGLAAIVTITLAIGTTVMARNNAIIRQLPCVETLGSLTVICSDKTGTLTKNQMTAVAIRTAANLYRITGSGYAPEGQFTTSDSQPLNSGQLAAVRTIMEGAVLCNDSSLSQSKAAGPSQKPDYIPSGAPTEVSLITAAMKAGIDHKGLCDSQPRLASVPFESAHKFMATVHDDAGKRVLYVKGAPDRLLPACSSQVSCDGDLNQTVPVDIKLWETEQAVLSRQGLRVLVLCR